MMISVWTNPTAIFILIGAQMTEQSQVKHELSFCARVLLGNIRRIFLFKNLGYWNAYSMLSFVLVYTHLNQDTQGKDTQALTVGRFATHSTANS